MTLSPAIHPVCLSFLSPSLFLYSHDLPLPFCTSLSFPPLTLSDALRAHALPPRPFSTSLHPSSRCRPLFRLPARSCDRSVPLALRSSTNASRLACSSLHSSPATSPRSSVLLSALLGPPCNCFFLSPFLSRCFELFDRTFSSWRTIFYVRQCPSSFRARSFDPT